MIFLATRAHCSQKASEMWQKCDGHDSLFSECWLHTVHFPDGLQNAVPQPWQETLPADEHTAKQNLLRRAVEGLDLSFEPITTEKSRRRSLAKNGTGAGLFLSDQALMWQGHEENVDLAPLLMACVLHAPVTKRTSMSLSYAAKHLIMLTVSSSDPRLTAWFVCLGKKGQQQLHSVLFSLSRRGALMCGFATHFHVRTKGGGI